MARISPHNRATGKPRNGSTATRAAGEQRKSEIMPLDMRNAIFAAVVAAALVAACTAPPPRLPTAEIRPPEGFPEQHYRQAAARGVPVFRIDPATSRIVIEVFRAGSLARLGHDHVIASHDVHGFVAPSEGRSDLYIALERLFVDEPELRAEAGFDTQPSADDVAGTRGNMLRALDAARYPFAVIRIVRDPASGQDSPGDVAITVHGATRTLRVPLHIDSGDVQIRVAGELSLRQTDFGIEPLSVLGGALRVQDTVKLRYRIEARRVE
jgi:hypothetical protein